MNRLAWTLARAGGWSRMLLVTLCTAVVSGLLLVAVALLLLPKHPQEMFFNLVADPGVRGGTTFGTVLLSVPILLLLHQAVRLGTATRERRLAALRMAGATPAQVRLLGALEVGIPSFVGGVLGLLVYGLLRLMFGGMSYAEATSVPFRRQQLRLVPTTVTPAWWQVLLVVLAVTLLGVAVGALASRGLVVTPLGVTRRQRTAPPRAWGFLLLALAAAIAPLAVKNPSWSTAVGMACVALSVLGIASLAPWVTYRVGHRLARRARSATMLLAASRMAADPRPLGRAAAAVGAIGLVSGGSGALVADLFVTNNLESFYVVSMVIVFGALLVALTVVAWTLAVHTVESLLERKRSTAALVAGGASLRELERAQRTECGLAAVPLAALGVVLGTAALGFFIETYSPAGVVLMLTNLLVTPALTWLAVVAAVRLVRPWTVRAGAAANLRTE
jgi:hypothetical protein